MSSAMLQLKRLSKSHNLTASLIRGSLGSGVLRMLYALLTFAVSVVLARNLGPEGYGVYAFVFSLVALFAIPSQLGLPTLVVREVARYQLQKEWGFIKGLLRRVNGIVLGFSLLLIVSAGLIIWLFGSAIDRTKLETFVWALVLVPFFALGNIRAAALQGLRKVVQAQLPEMLLRPALLLLFACGALSFGGRLTPPTAMALHVLAWTCAFLFGVMLLQRSLPPEVRTATASYEHAAWLRSIAPLSLISGMHIISSNTDIVMLDFLTTSKEVGMYRVAVQGAVLVSFALTAVNAVIAPHISRLYNAGNTQRLQELVTLSARIILSTSLPLAATLIVFGDHILNLFFGRKYEGAHLALAILCGGQIVNATMGSVDFLLNMSGHEHDTAKGLIIAALSNIVLNLVLIPFFGMAGAAAATALSLSFWNVLLHLEVSRRVGINSLALPLFSKPQHGA